MSRAQALKAKQTAAVARIDVANLPTGGAWLNGARKAAVSRLQQMGLPARRDEYWGFTRPDLLVAPAAQAAPVLPVEAVPPFDAIERLKIVFVDGVLDLEASDDLSAENLEISSLAEAGRRDIHWAQDLYGALEAAAHDPVARPLGALNTALATEGVLIRVTGKVSRPVSLCYLRREAESDAVLHHLIRLEAGAEMTLLENGPAAARLNKVTEVDLAAGASFHHVRTQGRDHGRQAVALLFARIAEKARFKSFTLTVNGALTRNEAVIDITGDDAVVTIAGAAAGDGSDGVFHQDDTIFLTHDGVNCQSRQVFKKVLRNGATGVFQGKILVRPGAQKTDGYQLAQALMLDDDSQFLAKPELEIHADDVACSHGATVGAIDEEALFYLVSRGVPRRIAKDMLVLALLADALDEIEDQPIRDDLKSRLQGWVERHAR